ncbi:MAG: hypothetical protein WCA07_16165 [Gloeobacterales cyanobacterium]
MKQISWLFLALVSQTLLSTASATPLPPNPQRIRESSVLQVGQTQSVRLGAATPVSATQDTQSSGEIQVFNQSGTPIQVILTRKDGTTQGSYWNFSSREGRGKDMRLKVDQKPLVLSLGDVVAVIAMDGSRNFWGPYITGRSNIPLGWDSKKKMWTLTVNRGVESVAASTTITANPAKNVSTPTTTGRRGSLRVGNTTDLKVRVVLTKRDGSVAGAFWDYEPQEGSAEGVELSLGENPLVVQEGDILMAFSPEFPDHYWGPDIIGTTPAPFWDNKRKVWSALLKP